MSNGGNVITFSLYYIRKYLMIKHLEARGVEPLFPTPMSSKIQERLYARGFREGKRFMEMSGWRWMLLVLLLGGQRLETSGIAVFDSLFP